MKMKLVTAPDFDPARSVLLATPEPGPVGQPGACGLWRLPSGQHALVRRLGEAEPGEGGWWLELLDPDRAERLVEAAGDGPGDQG